MALEQTYGPFPEWSIPNIASNIDRGSRKVYITDITEPFTLALVRDVAEDFPLLIRKHFFRLNFDCSISFSQHWHLSTIVYPPWANLLIHFYGKEQNLSGCSRAPTKSRQSRVIKFGKISRNFTPLLSSSSWMAVSDISSRQIRFWSTPWTSDYPEEYKVSLSIIDA